MLKLCGEGPLHDAYTNYIQWPKVVKTVYLPEQLHSFGRMAFATDCTADNKATFMPSGRGAPAGRVMACVMACLLVCM